MKMTPSDRDRGTFLGGAIGLAELLVFTILFLDIIFSLGDARMMGVGHGGIAGNGGMDGQTGVGVHSKYSPQTDPPNRNPLNNQPPHLNLISFD
jgi:hypothetical protein